MTMTPIPPDVPPLLADAGGDAVGTAGWVTVIGGAITAITGGIVYLWRTAGRQNRADRRADREEWKELMEVQGARMVEIAEQAKAAAAAAAVRERELLDRVATLERGRHDADLMIERLTSWVEYAESVLDAAPGIRYRKFDFSRSRSGTFPALKPPTEGQQ